MRSTYKQLYSFTLFLPLFFLNACGGGGGSTANNPSSTNLVATAVRGAAPLSTCPNGGITVDGGIDSNGNKVLDISEVTSTQYVCNGTNGLSTLVLVTNEPAGANCASGGKKVSAGQDTNSNSALDASEITTTAYVCNGANGTSGSNGLNSLMLIVPEPAGTFCTYGGNKASSGIDTNANGVLDTAEITASNYVCNGAPGLGVTWVNVTGTSMQAASNIGYLANNDVAQVTITLPASPSLGDIVQVSGIGAGGWKVAQNAGQSIILDSGIGATWTARETVRAWNSVASSADGAKLVASVNGGQLYTSTDYGVTWTARDAVREWQSVASSADGTKLVACVWGALGGQLYTSTDSGVTWTARESVRTWMSVASSADGTKLVASVYGGQLYTSNDSGVTWTARDAAREWRTVASSADGTKLVAVVAGMLGGQIYTSTDSGVSWTARDTARYWVSVASSADGAKLVATTQGDYLYTSTDSGVTWTARYAVGSFGSVASSANGTKLVAVSGLYSSDSGVTWTVRGGNFSYVASSADGTKLVAARPGGQIYTSTISTTTGIAGFLSGDQYCAVELQYIGNNTFMDLSYVGILRLQ